MNILPKKRWHVRTRENIARVRRDEAQAAQEEKERQERVKLAEREARRQLLLEKSRLRLPKTDKVESKNKIDIEKDSSDTTGLNEHINFFQELEDGTAEQKQTNKETEKEKKEEKEKYEKQIGYLTYLGQDTNEALGRKSWYEVAPERSTEDVNGVKSLKAKSREDPLTIFKKYMEVSKKEENNSSTLSSKKLSEYKSLLSKEMKEYSRKRKRSRSRSASRDRNSYKRHRRTLSEDKIKNKKGKKHKKKSKKHKKRKEISESSNVSSEDEQTNIEKIKKLEVLRLQRLQREKAERQRTEDLLNKINGKGQSTSKQIEPIRQKYNSQFNPYLAKQNYD